MHWQFDFPDRKRFVISFKVFFIPLMIKRNFSLELAEKLGQNERQVFVINGLGKNFCVYFYVYKLLINSFFLFRVKINVHASIFSSW